MLGKSKRWMPSYRNEARLIEFVTPRRKLGATSLAKPEEHSAMRSRAEPDAGSCQASDSRPAPTPSTTPTPTGKRRGRTLCGIDLLREVEVPVPVRHGLGHILELVGGVGGGGQEVVGVAEERPESPTLVQGFGHVRPSPSALAGTKVLD